MGHERWFRGQHDGQNRPFDWLTPARQHGIRWQRAKDLYEQAVQQAHGATTGLVQEIYLALLADAHRDASRPSPGKITRTMRLEAEQAGRKVRNGRVSQLTGQPMAPGKRTLTSYIDREKDAQRTPDTLPAVHRQVTRGASIPDELSDRRIQAHLAAAFGHFEELDALEAEARDADLAIASMLPTEPRKAPMDPSHRQQVSVPSLEAEAWKYARGESPTGRELVYSRPARGASAAEWALLKPARAGGAPLDAGLRASLGERLGDPLHDVRVHTDQRADSVARAVGARAWAFGQDVGFARGAWAPHSAEGQERIAHEVVHVLQQRGGAPALLMDDQPPGVTFYFSVRVNREMGPDELLLEFIQQYARLATREEAEAARTARGWHWTGTRRVADAEAVHRGSVLIRVTDLSLTPATPEERQAIRATVSGMDEEERQALYREVDRRFWERTGYRPGQQLGDSADDQRMEAYWLELRNDLVRSREAILDLPTHIRELLFDPTAARRLAPADYERVLRIGRRLSALSAMELAELQTQSTGQTDDWATFEASLEAYLASADEVSGDLAQASDSTAAGETAPDTAGDPLEQAARLHGQTEGRLAALAQEILELYESQLEGAPTRFWSIDHIFAASGFSEPITDRMNEAQEYVDAGLAEAGADDYWHSTVLARAIENGLITDEADHERFLEIAERERRLAIIKWATWRAAELALSLTPARGAGAGGMLFARAPQSTSTALTAINRVARNSGISGTYRNVVESMSARAAQFQELVSGGIRAGTSFVRNGVKFDFLDVGRRMLVDAKGPGYANFVDGAGNFYRWFSGRRTLVDQASNQVRAAAGETVEWVFAEQRAMEATRRLFMTLEDGHPVLAAMNAGRLLLRVH